jgi:signal transduction histidine kinase
MVFVNPVRNFVFWLVFGISNRVKLPEQLNITALLIIFGTFGLVLFGSIFYLSIIIERQKRARSELQRSLDKLKAAYQDLDEQAKIIVKTDLELSRTEEELGKKIDGLYALHELGRTISATFNTEELFRRIQEEAFISRLGFEKGLVMTILEDPKELICKVQIGYKPEEAKRIKSQVTSDKIFDILKREKFILMQRLEEANETQTALANLFGVISFVVAPIMSKEQVYGFIFAGNESSYNILTESDAELLSILASQMSQALENTQLYEQIWRSHRELELKVKERTKELAEANEELMRLNKVKSEFVSAVSHELRTPLTSIKGYASILSQEKLGSIPEAVKERLERINKHTNSLTELIDDLLDISRIESGKIEMKMEELKIRELIDAVLDVVRPQAKEREIEIKVDITAEATEIWADRGQIERVFLNLLNNAIKFTPEGGKIIVGTMEKDDRIQIDVSDTGIGIAEVDLKKIFTEFYRVDNPINQKIKGTGLGLSLTRRIIEAHKGKIWVTSKLGKGSTFSFTLLKRGVKEF